MPSADLSTVIWSAIATMITIVLPAFFLHRVSMVKVDAQSDKDLRTDLFARIQVLENRWSELEKERYILVKENTALAVKASRVDDLELRVVKLELENEELRSHNDHLEDQVRELRHQLKDLQHDPRN